MKILLKCVCNRPSCAGAKDETIEAKADDAKWLIENGVGVAVNDDCEPANDTKTKKRRNEAKANEAKDDKVNEPTGNSDSASAE